MRTIPFARSLGLAALFGLATASGLATFGTPAAAFSKRVHNACRTDYHRFCPGYKVESASLRECMKSAGFNVSIGCRRALAAEGEIPAKWAR